MKVATWNACRGKAEKKLPLLISRYNIDIAAVQEIGKPLDPIAASCEWKGDNRNCGIMTYSRSPFNLRPIPLFAIRTKLYHAVVVYSGRRKLMNLVNLWVKPAVKPSGFNGDGYGFSLMSALRAIEPLLDQSTIVLGDTNILHPVWVWEWFGERGMISAYHEFTREKFSRESRATLYHRKGSKGYHIDMCFIPNSWKIGLKNVEVGARSEWITVSDHCPIFVEIVDTVLGM